VARHESLRTVFRSVEGVPLQVVTPVRAVPFEVVDLYSQSADEEEMQQRLKERSRRPFDLSRDLMLRATLLQVGEDEYWLLLVIHHIASDGWSMGVLLRELGILYEAFRKGQPSPLPELAIQYSDFARWQREWLQGEVLEKQLSYWRKRLAGAPAVLQLWTDHPRPGQPRREGARETVVLEEGLTASLAALAREEGATLFMILLAGFQALLHRYTGQTDLAVGSPIANRNQAETQGLIGFFVNTLVLRADLSGDPSFREVLGRVRERALEAYEHQDLPFQKLLEALEPERSFSHSPLFQAMFVLKEAQGGLGLPGVSARAEEIGSGTAKFDLMLSLQEAGRQIRGWIEYATELFEAETIRRMVGHYETLLTSAVRVPDQRISTLPLLSEAERRRILADWGAAKAEHPADTVIHELFEAQAALRPGSVAVVCGEQQLTYHELNARASQLARHLRNLGVGPEALVGLCAEPSLEMIVGLVGILKAGGAYVPLDPSYPRERLALMLEDTQSAVILTQQALVNSLPPHKAHVLCMDSDWEAIKQEGTTDIESGVAPSNLAYVIYTSGSTGRPKGVLITHHNVFRLFKATHAQFGFDENDVWTLFHSYSFDFSVWEIWGALFYGGRLVVVPGWMRRSPEAFHALLCREQATVLGQTPSAFRQLNNADASAESARSLALRLIIFGGEAIDLQDIKSWFARHGDQTPRLVNMYGITETTVHSTYRFLTEEDVAATSGTPIGVPLPDTEVYVLGGHRQPVPVGVPGELYVGGPSLARGYLNRPDLTAERFIPNPFSNRLEARLYKSGDLVRYWPDGDIEYLGRIDQQVKIRGYRIEVGEIEAVLREHPAVTATVVVLREDAPGDKRLVAYIVPKQGESLTVVQLRGILGRRLPEYMLPSRFEFLRSLAVTPSGKVDRRALPTPGESRPEVGNPFEAPRTDLEERLAKIWREVLCLDQVGIDDNFFHLGGNSLLATRVVSAARKEFGGEVSLRRFFEMPTLAGLAVGVVESLAEEVGQAESQHFLDELEAPAPRS